MSEKTDMSERYKLGLTRNRLFEFDNAVIFSGRRNFTEDGLRKALRLLCFKEPIITSRVCLENDGEAYAVTGEVEQNVVFCSENHDELIFRYEKEGLEFYRKAFEFSYTSDGFLVIAAHTALSDAKALLRLAGYLEEFYNEPLKNAEPSVVNLISEKTDLPLEVASPIIDRLSADLDLKWQKDARAFDVEDYRKAKKAYDSIKGDTKNICAEIDEATMVVLREYCKANNMDVVSLVGFAFYDALLQNLQGKKKFRKMNICADERLFFINFEDYGVGAYNGTSQVSCKKKFVNGTFEQRAKAFHIECYKNLTSTFKVFYDDVLLMRVSPSLCDSAYLYKAGLFKSKASKTVAESYGCAAEKLCDYFYCNLDQQFWSSLKSFSEIYVAEPFKMRCATALDFWVINGAGNINFRYKLSKCETAVAEKIVETAISNLRRIPCK